MGVYKVVTQGVQPEAEAQQVIKRLSALLKVDAQKAMTLLKNKPVVLKRVEDAATAKKYQAALLKAGLRCHIVAEAAVTSLETSKAAPNLTQFKAESAARKAAAAREAEEQARFEAEVLAEEAMLRDKRRMRRLTVAAVLLLGLAGLWFFGQGDAPPDEIPASAVADQPPSAEVLAEALQPDVQEIYRQDEAHLKKLTQAQITDSEARTYQLQQLEALQTRLDGLSGLLGENASWQKAFARHQGKLDELREKVREVPMPFHLFRSQSQLLHVQISILDKKVRLYE